MNVFINIFFIFIFIFTMLFFKMPNIDNTNYLAHKLTIFCLLFLYQALLLILSKMKSGCKIDPVEVFSISVETAAIGVIGYSMYTDLQYYKINPIDHFYVTTHTQYLYITIIITLLLTFVNSIKLLFGYKPYDCVKY